MRFILPINAAINAQKCQASFDVRYYLNGFHVTKTTVEAISGHYAYQAKLKEFSIPDNVAIHCANNELPDSMIIQMNQTIKKPAKRVGCEFVVFDVNESEVIATTIDQFGGKVGCFLGKVIDVRFPDFSKIITDGEINAGEPVGFNASYLKKLSEVADGHIAAVKMQAYGPEKATVFDIINRTNMLYDAKFVLMPLRLSCLE